MGLGLDGYGTGFVAEIAATMIGNQITSLSAEKLIKNPYFSLFSPLPSTIVPSNTLGQFTHLKKLCPKSGRKEAKMAGWTQM